MAKKAQRKGKTKRASAAPPAEAATAGEMHLAYFEREAALSRSPAYVAAAYDDDADTDAWGVPGRTIIAEGDSWFNYSLLGSDLIDYLRSRHGCRVLKNFAQPGDTLENMVYGTEYDGEFQRRTPQFDATVALVAELQPRAFLFSGGGNDIAGAEFAAFLDHAAASETPLRTWYADRMFGSVMPAMYQRMIDRVLEASAQTHIFSHGYGNAIPSGIPAEFLGIPIGPWLRPGLVGKGWTDLNQGRAVVTDLIGRFNDMLAGLARRNSHFHHVDLRPHILDRYWENELHLGPQGFIVCASKLYEAIAVNVPGWPV